MKAILKTACGGSQMIDMPSVTRVHRVPIRSYFSAPATFGGWNVEYRARDFDLVDVILVDSEKIAVYYERVV